MSEPNISFSAICTRFALEAFIETLQRTTATTIIINFMLEGYLCIVMVFEKLLFDINYKNYSPILGSRLF